MVALPNSDFSRSESCFAFKARVDPLGAMPFDWLCSQTSQMGQIHIPNQVMMYIERLTRRAGDFPKSFKTISRDSRDSLHPVHIFILHCCQFRSKRVCRLLKFYFIFKKETCQGLLLEAKVR